MTYDEIPRSMQVGMVAEKFYNAYKPSIAVVKVADREVPTMHKLRWEILPVKNGYKISTFMCCSCSDLNSNSL